MSDATPLELRNIGPETEKWLHKIGIDSKAEFEKLGAEKTYKLLLEAGHEENLDLHYALVGAEKDIDWRIVAERAKRKIASRFADVDEP